MGGMRPSGFHVNKPAVFGIVAACVLLVLGYRYFWTSKGLGGFGGGPKTVELSQDAIQPYKVIMSKDGLPDAVVQSGAHMMLNASKLAPVPVLGELSIKFMNHSEMKEVELDGKKLKVYVEQVVGTEGQPKLDVLLLHGMAFSSKNWMDIKTTYHLANWGYRAIAIDLPGKGKTTDAIEPAQYGSFLGAVISTMKMTKPVIIAPSASGRNALPYLFDEPTKSTEKATGFVPIAPSSASTYVDKYPQSQLPTLIVYGSNDKAGIPTKESLEHLPRSFIAPLTGAGHACYLDKPEEFHRVLQYFLQQLTV